MGDGWWVITSYIIHLPSYRIQLAVVSAVRNAVRAATNIFTVISINFVFFIVSFLHFYIFSSLGPFLSFVLQVKCKANFWSSESQQVHLIGRVVTKVNRVSAEPSSLELCWAAAFTRLCNLIAKAKVLHLRQSLSVVGLPWPTLGGEGRRYQTNAWEMLHGYAYSAKNCGIVLEMM